MTKIKAVVFDVGDVLYGWDIGALYAKLIADPVRRDWFLRTVVTPDWHFQHDRGRPSAETIPELQAQYPAEAELIGVYADRWLETITGPVPGMHALVAELADAGVPLFGITNFAAEFWDRFRPTAPIFDLFGDIVVSGAEQMFKPEPAIYRLALQRFGLVPGEGLFVDDRIENVRGGAAEGFPGHHFSGAARLRERLVAEGLLDHPGRRGVQAA
ncbi:HAD family hydrolase [Polymorphobacter fuscus]|uniref:HAD-IA family hydrolase n=1 Tax=Sandarakinorhabdus fusca TaxID=1439888 RepID=A0A7C9KIT8_9SPHN|nr:HAD family phosphatase [Polymorphobacter fuscus]KAB7646334.1 HAD family phosphatase [Polymorphobacter fuscus]MQT17559.1 HAD-IA family hydrolase [Polymorphobacter fuscus]NJC09899.1 2-haloacid dehalogenase [Polymorphobacter fuscus]